MVHAASTFVIADAQPQCGRPHDHNKYDASGLHKIVEIAGIHVECLSKSADKILESYSPRKIVIGITEVHAESSLISRSWMDLFGVWC